MSSQSPAPPDGVNSEDPVIEESAADEPVVKTESGITIGTVLSNELVKIMKGVVDYLTEYKDEK